MCPRSQTCSFGLINCDSARLENGGFGVVVVVVVVVGVAPLVMLPGWRTVVSASGSGSWSLARLVGGWLPGVVGSGLGLGSRSWLSLWGWAWAGSGSGSWLWSVSGLWSW